MPPATLAPPDPATSTSPDTPNTMPASSPAAMEAAIKTLRSKADEWAKLPLGERRRLLEEVRKGMVEVAERWAHAGCRAKGISLEEPRSGEEWLGGPFVILRNIRLLQRSLAEIAKNGKPKIPRGIRTRANGQVVARAFPADIWDNAFFPGVTAEVWMQPGIDAAEMRRRQAHFYAEPRTRGQVLLVLGAGNVSSIGPMDALYKLFVEHAVVLYKVHPVNAYVAPLFEEAFRPLVEAGYLRLAYGGADVGAFLCEHPEVDEIHITGSDKTVEAIAFGVGAEGAQRKAENRPKNTKPISSELGNVSPVLIVPATWSDAELRYQAENVASMLTNNAGFNCNAARVLITASWWPQREAFLDAVEHYLSLGRPRQAYYPGAHGRFDHFVSAHPEARRIGEAQPGALPWVLIRGLDPERRDDICFRTEAFCSVFAEVALDGVNVPGWLGQAVDFCNDTLWGTLNATLIVHPSIEDDPEAAAAVSHAIEDLHYGNVVINHWAAVGYGLCVTPWGAPPGHTLQDIQSGTGVVHNTLMLEGSEKVVVRSPFRAFPRPPWFVGHKTADRVGKAMTYFEAAPSTLKLPGLLAAALAG
jgi:acyl-CoA reductase-like NAD-dependent aldehyde dehydrogenase